MFKKCDLFILAAEPSGDLHGSKLVEKLLEANPQLKISAVAGPRMRQLPIYEAFQMEELQVMGFIDVLFSLKRMIKIFFKIRKKILELQPKAVVCIDYPGFNLRLERSLRKKNYTGKLIHYICPTVWAWGKKRIPQMANTLDLLLTLFPFEPKCFEKTKLPVVYVGHPLAAHIHPLAQINETGYLALFPGSRHTEVLRNLPIQLAAAEKIASIDPSLKIGVSVAQQTLLPLVKRLSGNAGLHYFLPQDQVNLMRNAKAAIATSGTITLELALHGVPTVVNYAIRPLDLFLATKIFKINLPHYCIVNIILSKRVFPELYGPELSIENLYLSIKKIWTQEDIRRQIYLECVELHRILGGRNASENAAQAILSL